MAGNTMMIYRTATTNGTQTTYQYFGNASIPNVACELFMRSGTTAQVVTITSFATDVSAVDLTSFLGAGGVLVGPVELK